MSESQLQGTNLSMYEQITICIYRTQEKNVDTCRLQYNVYKTNF